MRRLTLIAAALLTPAALLMPTSGAASAATTPTRGALHSHAAVLRTGCHHHRYTYRVHVPSKNWYMTVRLLNPRGRAVETDHPYGGGSTGSGHVQLCDYERTGRYTLVGKGHWTDDLGTDHPFTVRPAHFAVRRAR